MTNIDPTTLLQRNKKG